jgi:hypothetical protein
MRGVLMKTRGQVFQLQASELGTIAATPFIDQPLLGVVLVSMTPLHQAGSALPRNLFNVGDGIAFSIESHGLILGTG